MKKYFYIFSAVLLLGLGFYIYKLTTYTYITVKFKELRPFHAKLPVYYKGLVIGKATDRSHSDDYLYTKVKVVLFPKNLMLPVNTKILLKKEKRNDKEHDFLELVYPENPSKVMISDGTVLDGKATVDLETFFRNQDPDDIDHIKENLASASENLDNSLAELSDLFVLIQDVLKENEGNIKQFSGNLAKSANNLNQITTKFDRSIKQETLDSTFNNLDASFANIKASSGNLQVITGNLNGTTNSVNEAMPRIDSTLYQAQGLVSNANAISCGVRKTLSKPFGGLRILFGKTVNECDKKGCGR